MSFDRMMAIGGWGIGMVIWWFSNPTIGMGIIFISLTFSAITLIKLLNEQNKIARESAKEEKKLLSRYTSR